MPPRLAPDPGGVMSTAQWTIVVIAILTIVAIVIRSERRR
jgi:hypothetical protein